MITAVATTTETPTSLSNVAFFARNAILYGTIGIFLLVIGRMILTSTINLYKRLNPAPPPPPTMGFDLLPLPVFPTQSASERPSAIVLDTVGQRVPDYGPTATVYLMPKTPRGLLAVDRAKQVASSLGFILEPEQVSTDVYRWRRDIPLAATLEIDVVNTTLTMDVDWSSSVTLLQKRMIPSPQQLTSESRTLLRAMDLSNPDIATATPKINYYKALAGELRSVQSVNEADFVGVEFLRVTPNGLPSITPFDGQGIVSMLFSGSRDQGERVLALSSRYYPVDPYTHHTYPLQPARLALQALQAGQGYIIHKGIKPEAVVRSIELAYYEPFTAEPYYQPVYVFRGDDGFTAIVPALDPRSYQSF